MKYTLLLRFDFEDTDLDAIGHVLKLGRPATTTEVRAQIEEIVFAWLDDCADQQTGLE